MLCRGVNEQIKQLPTDSKSLIGRERLINNKYSTALWLKLSRSIFYFQAERGLLPPHAWNILVIRTNQWMTGDFHSIRFLSLVGCSMTDTLPKTNLVLVVLNYEKYVLFLYIHQVRVDLVHVQSQIVCNLPKVRVESKH